jgi:hypothetical protein
VGSTSSVRLASALLLLTIEQHTGARFDVDAWMAHLEGSGVPIGQRMYDARMKVRHTGSAKC